MSRTVVRNSFARQTIVAERRPAITGGCAWCGQVRGGPSARRTWLYTFRVDDDQGPRHSGAIAKGRLFCSRGCAEIYIDHSFDERRAR